MDAVKGRAIIWLKFIISLNKYRDKMNGYFNGEKPAGPKVKV